jgi:hypothetical protein
MGAGVERIDGLGRSLRDVARDMRQWETLKLAEQLSAEVCIEYQVYIMAVVIRTTGTNLRLDATRRDNA